MEAIANITINGRQYKVKMFDPATAFDFIHARIHAAVHGKNSVSLARMALGKCLTPMMKELEDEAVFQEWFSQHPEDMLPLEVAAIEALTAPYDPKPAAVNAEGAK